MKGGASCPDSYRANLPNPFHRRNEVRRQKDNRDHKTDNQRFHKTSSFSSRLLLGMS
jgi:hypothetical protein